MNQSLSTRQLRLVALLLLVVVVAGGYWVVVRHKSSTPTTSVSPPAHKTTTPTAPAPTKPHVHSTAPAKVAVSGLPSAVSRALQKHSVVVVSLSSPNADLDKLASAEARAGAAVTSAGFVNLDVNRQRSGMPILRKLGVVDTPAVLVVKRPHVVASEFHGFVDLNVVAQAVKDAR
jgi:hypothetical protein